MFVLIPCYLPTLKDIDYFSQGLGDLNRAIGWYFRILEIDDKWVSLVLFRVPILTVT